MRNSTTVGQLARTGFTDASRASELLSHDQFADLVQDSDFIEEFSVAANPDLAVLQLSRILDLESEETVAGVPTNDAVEAGKIRLSLTQDREFRTRLFHVLGASEALGNYLIRHPEAASVLTKNGEDRDRLSRDELEQLFVEAVESCTCEDESWEHEASYLRIAYRRRLLALAARDLSGEVAFEEVTAELADLADAVLAACLHLAKATLPEDAAPCRFAIIALGKCGGRELNYISDVDVIFVAEPGLGPDGNPVDEHEALQTATQLAKGVMKAANEATPEGTIWEVDPALRPEGKAGALVRTLGSHIGYYERWAQTWEFQALLKARYAAGDKKLGEAYVDAMLPFVWSASERDGFVDDVQAMRRRVEENLPKDQADREIKLGPGGLRDVEFSVQLLQLVHGRSDVMVRSPNTLIALNAMSMWGYVGRKDAQELAEAYRFLRTLEHRIQLFRLQRTHTMPTDELALRSIARSMGFFKDPVRELDKAWSKHKQTVRRLHEKIFYRPLLNAVAQLGSDEARLTREDAIARLNVLGYQDPDGALRNIEALTSGVSRRAQLQKTLLPVLLGWFADSPDPDAGLKSFRRVSEALGTTPWYLRLLRDESETAMRMARILGSSEFVTELLMRAPEAVAMLSSEDQLRPRTHEELRAEVESSRRRHTQPEAAIEAVRAVRRRELFRIASADICDLIEVEQVGEALSAVADVTIEAAVNIAIRAYEERSTVGFPTRFTVIGMGRLGGNEAGYSSDADVMFVHDPLPGADEQEATKAALWVANEARRLLALPSADPPLEIDSDLRPEGKSGALVRTLASYRAYYERWSDPWEAQALLRARYLAGDSDLGAEFIELINPLRYPPGGLDEKTVMEIRKLKARMESERLPRGADPARHLKLGPGGLSDIEWVAQLIQMNHAAEDQNLQLTGTLQVLTNSVDDELLELQDCESLASAWRLASRIRNANVLYTGKSGDQLPTDPRALAGVGQMLGYGQGDTMALLEDYRRRTRQARQVAERVFYGWTD